MITTKIEAGIEQIVRTCKEEKKTTKQLAEAIQEYFKLIEEPEDHECEWTHMETLNGSYVCKKCGSVLPF
jgi:hypothetical protein